MDELAAYLEVYESPPAVLSVGLVAGENLSRGGLSAAPRSSSGPVTWYSLAKAEAAIKAKKDQKLKDISGGEVVLLGTPRNVGGKSLKAGDQFFYEPTTKTVKAIKTLAQLRSEEKPAAAAPAPKPSSSTYPVAKLQEVLRGVGSPASARLKDGKWGPTTRGEWERAAKAVGGDATSSGKGGATQASVSTATYNALLQRAQAVALGVKPPLFGTAAPKPAPKSAPAKVAPAPKPAPAPAPKPTAPSKPGMSKVAVSQVQDVAVALGAKIARDGLFGPATVNAWKQAATKRKLDPALDRAGPKEVWVVPATLAALTTAARAPSKPPAPKAPAPKTAPKTAPAKPTEPSKAGLAKTSVKQIQALEITLGAKIAADGLFGPNTVKAWKQSAKLRKLDETIDRAGPTEAWVSPATFAALKAAAAAKTAPKPAPKPVAVASKKGTEPRKSGMTKVNVGQLQDVLRSLGNTALKRDGLFGPNTAKAWTAAAERRKLDGAVDRAGPIEAWVVPATFAALSKAVGDKTAAPKGAPVSAKPAAPTPTPAPGGAPATLLEPISPTQLTTVFSGFGKKAANAKEIQDAWAAIAKTRGLNGNSSMTAKGFEVVPATRDALVKEATTIVNAKKIVDNSKVIVPVKSLQQALKSANQTDAYKGRFPSINVSGVWNTATESAFFIYLNIPAGNISTWEKALPTLLSSDKKTVKLPANFAAQIVSASTNYEKLQKTIQQKEADAKKVANAEKALEAKIAAQAGKASTLVSVFTLQQALSEIREKQKEGRVPGPILPGIALSGTWDANTDKGLFDSFSKEIWGADRVPDGVWPKLVNRILVKSTTPKQLSGLYGLFGDLAESVQTANYIRLPADVAKNVQDLAAAFVARSAKKGEMTDSAKEISVPVTTKTKSVAGEPILITGRAPAPSPTPAPARVPAPTPLPIPTGEQIQVPSIETPDGGQVDIPAVPTPLPTPIAPPTPLYVPPTRIPAPLPEPEPEPEPEPFPPAAAAPIVPVQEASVVPVPKTGSGALIALALMAGVGVAAFLFSRPDRDRMQSQP